MIKKLGDGLKILGTGEITRKIDVEAHIFSKAAAEKIGKAGGQAKVIGAAAQAGLEAQADRYQESIE